MLFLSNGSVRRSFAICKDRLGTNTTKTHKPSVSLLQVAGWAEAHYVDLMPHNPLGPVCTAACVHLGAAVPNFAWMEVHSPAYSKYFARLHFRSCCSSCRRLLSLSAPCEA
jgi:hypothetical protein